MMRWFILRGLLFVKEYPALYTLWRKLKRSEVGVLSTPATDLCIEGFESSANSFTLNVVRHLGGELRIAHHCHTVASVKLALQYGTPSLILFRDPAEAIPSLVTRYRPDLLEATHAYIRFYRYIDRVSEQVMLSSFEEVTQHIDHTLRKISLLTGIQFQEYSNVETVEREVRRRMRAWQKANSAPYATPLPTAERDMEKKRLRKRLFTMSEYGKTQRVYERVRGAYGRQEERIMPRMERSE